MLSPGEDFFLAADFLEALFRDVVFLDEDFFAALFLGADFLDADFFAARFPGADFFDADFLEEPFEYPDFLAGTLAPSFRASESPIAIACFLLVTFLPLPLFSLPCFSSCIVFSTLSCDFFEYFAIAYF
jgi:hypothetical protein